MIKSKILVVLGVALAVLLAINLVQRSGHKKATSQSATAVIIPGPIVADDLSRISLGFGDNAETVVLNHQPTGWVIDTAWGAAVDQTRVDALVRNLQGLTGEYRSDNAAVLSDYGLADDNAVHINATNTAGETVIGLKVGRKPERYPGNFVRLSGENSVYVCQKNILGQLGIYGEPEAPKSRYFLDLQAVKEDRLAVDKIVLKGDQELTLVKKFAVEEPDSAGAEPTIDRNTWEWELAGHAKAALAKTKVDAVLNSLVVIRAADIVDPDADLASYGLDSPARQASLYLQDGRVVTLNFGGEHTASAGSPAGTFMQVAGQKTVWVVTEYSIKNIFKTESELESE